VTRPFGGALATKKILPLDESRVLWFDPCELLAHAVRPLRSDEVEAKTNMFWVPV